MSGDQLDLDAIEARMADPRYSEEFRGMMAVRDVPALVAEVRRLRAQVERVEDLHAGLVDLDLGVTVNTGYVLNSIRAALDGDV